MTPDGNLTPFNDIYVYDIDNQSRIDMNGFIKIINDGNIDPYRLSSPFSVYSEVSNSMVAIDSQAIQALHGVKGFVDPDDASISKTQTLYINPLGGDVEIGTDESRIEVGDGGAVISSPTVSVSASKTLNVSANKISSDVVFEQKIMTMRCTSSKTLSTTQTTIPLNTVILKQQVSNANLQNEHLRSDYANNRIICQKSGVIKLSASFTVSAGLSSGDAVNLSIVKNTSNIISYTSYSPSVSNGRLQMSIPPILIPVSANDTFSMKASNSTSARGTISNSTLYPTYLTIEYVCDN